jgi:phosphomevalonate kinase
MNTPTFNSGKLKSGETVCTKCQKRIIKANPQIGVKLKIHTLSEVQSALSELDDLDKKQLDRVKEIEEQLNKITMNVTSAFLSRKELKELPNIIGKDEVIDNLIQGTYNDGQGLLVSTNRRLIFVDKGLVYGVKVEDFPLSKITSIQYETGMLLGKIKIHTSGNIGIIENVDKKQAPKFSEFIRTKLSDLDNGVPSKTSNEDILGQIEKLNDLKEKGILSDAEFNEQKIKLLQKL